MKGEEKLIFGSTHLHFLSAIVFNNVSNLEPPNLNRYYDFKPLGPIRESSLKMHFNLFLRILDYESEKKKK